MAPAYHRELFKAGNPAVKLIERILPCYQSYFDKFDRLGGSIYTHDPSAISYVINPDLFTTKSAPVFVETIGRCMGQTVADWKHQWDDRPKVKICVDVDSEGVLALIKERLTKEL